MRHWLWTSCIFLCFSSAFGQQPDAGEIIERYVEHMKGEHTSRTDFKTITVSGSAKYGLVEMSMNGYWQFPDHKYLELTIQNVTMKIESNETLSWDYNPFSDELNITEKGVSQEDTISESGQIFFLRDELIKHESLGLEVSLSGIHTLDSLETYKITLSGKGILQHYYFNTETYLLHKVETGTDIYELYRYQYWENLPIPTVVVSHDEDQSFIMSFDSYEINTPIDSEIFEVPDELKSSMKEEEIDADKHFLLGEHFYENGEFEQALEQYNLAININPKHEVAFNQRGLTKEKFADYYGAIGDFNRAIELNPDYAQAYSNCGLAKYYLGDYQAALKDLNQALFRDSTLSTAYYNRAYTYSKLKRYHEALIDFNQVVELEADEGMNYFNRGIVRSMIGDYKGALADYNFALAREFRSAELFNRKGLAYYYQEDYTSALTEFELAVSMDETVSSYKKNLAKTMVETDQASSSLQIYNALIQQNPSDEEAYNLRGLAHYNLRDFDLALADFSQSIVINPTNATYYDNRGYAKENLMDFMGAIEDYSKSIELYASDPNIYYRRGLAKMGINNKYDACLDFKKASEMGSELASTAILQNCSYQSSVLER